jgi:hypothetical protein
MTGNGWRDRLERLLWWHPAGRAATFAAVGVAAAAAVHRGGDLDVVVPLLASMGGWAMSLIRWPPGGPS